MDLEKLKELIQIFEASELSEIEVEEDGRRMRLQKPGPAPLPPMAYAAPAMMLNYEQPGAATGAPAPADAAPEVDPSGGLPTIDSPMVGTFYLSPAPGEPPFVEVGTRVEEGATVCIVEAMKLMNEVTAKTSCVIEKVLVENGEPVEFGQALYAIRPQ